MYVSLVHVFQTTAERVCQQKHKLLVCIPFHVLPLLNKLFPEIAGCKGLQKKHVSTFFNDEFFRSYDINCRLDIRAGILRQLQCIGFF